MKKENMLLSLNGTLVYCSLEIDYGFVKFTHVASNSVFQINILDRFDRDVLDSYVNEVEQDCSRQRQNKLKDFLYLGISISNNTTGIILSNQCGQLLIPNDLFRVILNYVEPLCFKDNEAKMMGATIEEQHPIVQQLVQTPVVQAPQTAPVQPQPQPMVNPPMTGNIVGTNPLGTPAINAQTPMEVVRLETIDPVQAALNMPAGTTPFTPNAQ